MSQPNPAWLSDFCQAHKLPQSYAEDAQRYYMPLLEHICQRARSAGSPLVVGVNGAQGTGKSTLGDFLVTGARETAGLHAVSLSLDDLYLGKAARQQLAREVHPLLATRGVPGTHDLALADQFFAQLLDDGVQELPVPRFDKSRNDRMPLADWPQIAKPVQLLVLEGWCVGCQPQPENELEQPVNALERDEDIDASWRRYVNQALQLYQSRLWSRLDLLVMLRAPAFEQVYQWRSRQEARLVERTGVATPLSDPAAMQHFISHYERLTRWMLEEMPSRADRVFELDAAQRIVRTSANG